MKTFLIVLLVIALFAIAIFLLIRKPKKVQEIEDVVYPKPNDALLKPGNDFDIDKL